MAEMNSIDKTRQDKDCSHVQNCQVVVLGNMDNTIDHTFESANRVYDKNQLCPTIPTCGGGGTQPKVIEETRCVGGLSGGKWGKQFHQQDRVYKGDIALAHAANIPQGSYKYLVGEKKMSESVEIKQATKDGSIECAVGGCFDASFPESKTRRGLVHDHGNVTPTLTASNSEQINYVETQYRIRKLTPLECWRLMGYTDKDFNKAHDAGVSNSQLYKQAGNAIVKQVLMAIFSQMNIKGVKSWNQ